MPRRPRDAGESLVEILASLAILSIGVIGLLTALATHATTTGTNRNQAQASTVLLAAAEYVKALPYSAVVTGSTCSTATTVVDTTALPRDPLFAVRYGPTTAVSGTGCDVLAVVDVTVTGDGFTLTTDVVKRP